MLIYLEGPLQKLCFLCRSEIQDGVTAIHRLTLDPMGKCSNVFFSEITNIIKAKLYVNVHWMVLKKAFEHFPIWSNVNLCVAVAAILDFRST
jgi:hypothetical protein